MRIKLLSLVLTLLCSVLCQGYAFCAVGKTYRRVNRLQDSSDGCGVCPKAPNCSGEYLGRGCEGNGKIQGGIGVYLSWWPIKVFRPCPAYMAAGYNYRREGQTLDQVLFGEPSAKMKSRMEKMKSQESAGTKQKAAVPATIEDGK